MQKKWFLTVLALGMGLTANCSAAASPFADVPADHWAYDAVAQLAEDGILEGYGDKSFRGKPELIRGKKIIDIRRRGKALLIGLDNKLTIMVHLRMTGQMIHDGLERFAAGHPDGEFTEKMPGRFTRIYVDLDDGTHLYFNDLRKFGFWQVMVEQDLATDRFLNRLGPEPWDMAPDDFYNMLQRHKNSPVKAVILDQSNIQALVV